MTGSTLFTDAMALSSSGDLKRPTRSVGLMKSCTRRGEMPILMKS